MEGEGNGKKTENSKKTKIALLSLFPGGGGGGATEKRLKSGKKERKITLLNLYLLYQYHV